MEVDGEAQNLTPPHAETLYAGVIKIGRGDYVVDPYTYAKIRHDLPRGFVFWDQTGKALRAGYRSRDALQRDTVYSAS